MVQEFKSFPAQILLAVLMTVMMTVTLTTMMLATMRMTMRMVPKERCRCSRAGSRVNKLSCSDIHESSGEHLSRPFSLEMTMMVMVMN